MMSRKAKYMGSAILIAASTLVVTEMRATTRFLTPLTGPNEKYSYTSADLRYGEDPTLNMDNHLQTCWNFGTAANFHDTSEKRRKDYTTYFKKFHLYPILQYAAPPKLFTLTGNSIGLVLSDSKTTDLRTGKGSPGFHSMSLWNHSSTFRCAICEDPPPPAASAKKTHLKGTFITFTAYWWGRYGHATHDSLPWFAYLKETVGHHDDSNSKYILMDVRNAKDIITTIDPDFAAKRVVWAKTDEIFEIEGRVTTVEMPRTRENNPRMMDYLRFWLQKGRNRTSAGDVREKIIYYDRRNHRDTRAARYVRQDIEDELLIRTRQAMEKHGRKEELVVFNGLRNRTGSSMTVEEQFQLFKDATTIIGPHGSGMSGNLLWTNPYPESCERRVKVLEFIGDKDTAKETSPNRREPYISHWPWMRGWPFEWHHILYEHTSTRKSLVVNLDKFSEALDAMWGNKISTQV